MRYTDFDAEFPRRCLELLGRRPYDERGYACTRLLAIGGAIVTSTADRQFAIGTRVHIATGGEERQIAGVREFLKMRLRDELPKLRDRLLKEYDGSPPAYWSWDPTIFNLEDQRVGSDTLFRTIISSGKNALPRDAHGNDQRISDALRVFRNAFAHGNIWLLAGADFPKPDPRAEATGGIVGFALATTNPKYEEADPEGKRPQQNVETPFIVKGYLISPFDLRAIIEGWAVLLRDSGLSRGVGGQLVTEEAAD